MIPFLILLIFIAIFVIRILMYFGGTLGWCLSKLRLLIPVIFFFVCIYLEGHPDWLITKILFFKIPFTKDTFVVDVILCLMILYAVIMFFHDIFAPVIEKIQDIWLCKQERLENQEHKKREKLVFSIIPDMEKEYYYLKNPRRIITGCTAARGRNAKNVWISHPVQWTLGQYG